MFLTITKDSFFCVYLDLTSTLDRVCGEKAKTFCIARLLKGPVYIVVISFEVNEPITYLGRHSSRCALIYEYIHLGGHSSRWTFI
jgi:hypothetical protein